MILHDLTASGDRRFSPYCWRAKLVLAHKGLDYEARPLSFTEIDGLNPDGPRLTFPTPDDGDVSVADRWAIAEYLEANHPDAPPLFPTGKAHARFIQGWAFQTLHPSALRVIMMDVYDLLDPADKAYFRENREARFGMTLEAFAADRETHLQDVRQALQPLRGALEAAPFLAGGGPAYADFNPAAVFLWAETVDRPDLLEIDDPVRDWLARVRPNFPRMPVIVDRVKNLA